MYICVIAVIGIYCYFTLNKLDSWKINYYQTQEELADIQTKLDTFVKHNSPLIINDIEIANALKRNMVQPYIVSIPCI